MSEYLRHIRPRPCVAVGVTTTVTHGPHEKYDIQWHGQAISIISSFYERGRKLKNSYSHVKSEQFVVI